MDVSEEEILRLVAERDAMKQSRRFAESDAIRDQLRQVGIELYDKEKEWRSSDGRRGVMFTAGTSECILGDEDIQTALSRREEARRTKDWAVADSIRDDLRQQGVELDDKLNRWRTGNGRMGSYGAAGVGTAPPRQPVAQHIGGQSGSSFQSTNPRQMSSHLSKGSSSDVASTILQAQAAAQAYLASRGDPGAKSARPAYGAVTSSMTPLPPPPAPPRQPLAQIPIISAGHARPHRRAEEAALTLSDASVHALVSSRELARQNGDHAAAEAIRKDLRAHGIDVDDLHATWHAADGRRGAVSQCWVQAGGHALQQQPQQGMFPDQYGAAARKPQHGLGPYDTAIDAQQLF